MKFDINNPAFLQIAGASAPQSFIAIHTEQEDQAIFGIKSDGAVRIKTIKDGKTKITSYPDGLAIEDVKFQLYNDANTDIFIYGKITEISVSDDVDVTGVTSVQTKSCESLTRATIAGCEITDLDFSSNFNINYLAIDLVEMVSLNISNCLGLEHLSLLGCNKLTEIFAVGMNEDTAGVLERYIDDAGHEGITGTIVVRQGESYGIEQAAGYAGWTVEYQ